MERIKDYCLNSSLHGIRYIAEPESHWIERVFWACCCLVSWFYAAKIISEAVQEYQTGSINFVMETTYLKWDTEFPTVSFCQTEDLERAEAFLYKMKSNVSEETLFPETLVLNQIAFFAGFGNEFESCEDLECPAGDLRKIADEIRRSCRMLFRRCEWNEMPFECCHHFLQLETEIGPCFTVNNIQAKNFSKKAKFPMISNMDTGPGTLKVQLNSESAVYLMSREDVPNLNAKKNVVKMNTRESIRFYVTGMKNEPGVRDVSIDERKCRFPDENDLGVYPRYSYSACIVDCHKRAHIRYCNCTTYFMPHTKAEDACNLKGLQCLHNNKEVLMQLTDIWDKDRPGLQCDCLQSCEEIDLSVFYKSTKTFEGRGYGEVHIIMDHLPSDRFMRKVVRDTLDMVVSTGSTIGLFLGASLLSLVEFIHYFVLPCFEGKRADSPVQNTRPRPLVITHPRFAHLGRQLGNQGRQPAPKSLYINTTGVATRHQQGSLTLA